MDKNKIEYDLHRLWFDFCLKNPDIVNTQHTVIYFYCVYQWSVNQYNNKFQLQSKHAMIATGIKKHQTFSKAFKQLVEWGFVNIIEKCNNQYTQNIIKLVLPKKHKINTNTIKNDTLNNNDSPDNLVHVSNNSTTQTKNENNIKVIETDTNKSKNDQLNKFDLSFIEKDFESIFIEFIEYRKTIKKPFKTQRGVQTRYKELITLSGGDVDLAKKIVKQSIDMEWVGLFKLKNVNNFNCNKNNKLTGQYLPVENEEEKKRLLAKLGS